MIRIILENLLLFLLPSAVYFAWIYLTRDGSKKGIEFSGAPLIWLCVAGALLVIVTLVAFQGDEEGGRPGQTYVPPHMDKDGKIVPGQIK